MHYIKEDEKWGTKEESAYAPLKLHTINNCDQTTVPTFHNAMTYQFHCHEN